MGAVLTVAAAILHACSPNPGHEGDPSAGAAPQAAGAGPPAPPDEGDSAGEDSGSPVIEAGAPVRFLALGDTGEGNVTQFRVAAAMRGVCAELGCDFALLLGDNFYNSGVDSVTDSQFEEKFETPYVGLDFPFYAVLGNHDYGASGIGNEFWRAPFEVAYTDHSATWTMPDRFYTSRVGDVALYGLDTNAILWGFSDDQAAWLDAELEATDAPWTIAFGHHPYVSNGSHGNAGEYDGTTDPIFDGRNVLDFFDAHVCRKVDVYFCGHDHNLQWVATPCGTEFIVSGAGAKVSGLEGTNATWFQAAVPGFAWAEVEADVMRVRFYDQYGALLYARAIGRPL